MSKKSRDKDEESSEKVVWYKDKRKLIMAGGGAVALCMVVGIGLGVRGSADPVIIDKGTQSQEDPAKGGAGLGTEESPKASDVWVGYSNYPGDYTNVDYENNEYGLAAWEAGYEAYNEMMAEYNPDGTEKKPYPVALSASYGLSDVAVTTVSVDGSKTTVYFEVSVWGEDVPADFVVVYEDGSEASVETIEDSTISTAEKEGYELYSFVFTTNGKPVKYLKVAGPTVPEGKGFHDLNTYYSGKPADDAPDWNAWVADKYEKLLSEAGITAEEAKSLPESQ